MLIVPKVLPEPPRGISPSPPARTPWNGGGRGDHQALERVVPERRPQIYKMGMPTVIFGTDPRDGKVFTITRSIPCAYCGRRTRAGRLGAMNVSFGQPDPRDHRDQRGDLSGAPARP